MVAKVLATRSVEAAAADTRLAVAEFDRAGEWLAGARLGAMEPLAAEVWVFDEELARVLLVRHRWRGWVPPGGRVESGETPWEGASRELFEETGVRAPLLARPSAVAVRSYHPDLPVTLGLSYAVIVDGAVPLVAERGQPLAWTRLEHDWESCFPDDPPRLRAYAARVADHAVGVRPASESMG
jgi:8-oxo-dGTP diphosphatase